MTKALISIDYSYDFVADDGKLTAGKPAQAIEDRIAQVTQEAYDNGDYIFVPDVRKAVEEKAAVVKAYVVGDELKEIDLKLGDLTDAERQIILDGCLINYYRATK